MSDSTQYGISKDARLQDAEQTLRLIATLAAPAGLDDRVRAGLRVAPRPQARLLAWPRAISPVSGWLRSAAAAAIVCVVAGGGWGIYSHVQRGQVPAGVSAGRFSSAGTVRKPLTLNGPVVAHAVPVATKAGAVPTKNAAGPTVKAPSDGVKARSKTGAPAVVPAE